MSRLLARREAVNLLRAYPRHIQHLDAWRRCLDTVPIELGALLGRHPLTTTAVGSAQHNQRATPPNIFSFFDNIQKHAVSRPSFRLDLGVAAYPKTTLSGASRKQQQQKLDADVESTYLSVGVGEDAYFRRHDAIGVADGGPQEAAIHAALG